MPLQLYTAFHVLCADLSNLPVLMHVIPIPLNDGTAASYIEATQRSARVSRRKVPSCAQCDPCPGIWSRRGINPESAVLSADDGLRSIGSDPVDSCFSGRCPWPVPLPVRRYRTFRSSGLGIDAALLG